MMENLQDNPEKAGREMLDVEPMVRGNGWFPNERQVYNVLYHFHQHFDCLKGIGDVAKLHDRCLKLAGEISKDKKHKLRNQVDATFDKLPASLIF